MSDVTIGKRITCVASGMAVIGGMILAVALVLAGLCGVLLAAPFVAATGGQVYHAVVSHGSGDFWHYLAYAGWGLILLLAAAVFALAWLDVLLAAAIATPCWWLAGWLTHDNDFGAGLLLPMMIVMFFTTITRAYTDTLLPFFREAFRERQGVFGGYRTVLVDRFDALLHKEWQLYVSAALGFLGVMPFAYGAAVPALNMPGPTDLTGLGSGATFTVVVAWLIIWFVSFQIWRRLDTRMAHYHSLKMHVTAAGIASLGPMAGYALLGYRTGQIWPAVLGFAGGCFCYAFLGGIFTCEENLFEIAKRKLTHTPKAATHPVSADE